MTSDRKKPGVAFWATVVLVSVPVLYVLGFGPACWLADWHPNAWKPVWSFYYPLAAITARGPKQVADALVNYGEWGSCESPDRLPIALELSVEAWFNFARR